MPSEDLPELPASVQSAVTADTAIISWTAHANGRLEPCGCVAGMHGGLVRRASLLQRIPTEQRLLFEAGGWSGGAADYQQLRTNYYLKSLQSLQATAIGLRQISN